MRYRHNHKEKINLKRRKAAVAYYRKLESEKENADKQVRNNPNITPENLTARIRYLRQSIYDLIRVAYACDVLGIPIPQRLYEQTDNKIGFKRNSDNICWGLTYSNNNCEILNFDNSGIHSGFGGHRISWLDEPDEISEINPDMLQDFIHNFAVFESMFYKWFDELVGFQYIV